MQQVKLTIKLLLQFSDELSRCPSVNFETEDNSVPLRIQPLCNWVQGFETSNSPMPLAFMAWLAGRCEFMPPDTGVQEIHAIVSAAVLSVLKPEALEENYGKTQH